MEPLGGRFVIECSRCLRAKRKGKADETFPFVLRAKDGQPSRLQRTDAFLLDIQGGIDIPVMMSTAMRACPVASCETQCLQPMPAGGTCLLFASIREEKESRVYAGRMSTTSLSLMHPKTR